jgi:hypothetical protein
MLDIVYAEGAFFTIFEPLVKGLVAANGLMPCFWLNASEILCLVDVEAPRMFALRGHVARFADLHVTAFGKRESFSAR